MNRDSRWSFFLSSLQNWNRNCTTKDMFPAMLQIIKNTTVKRILSAINDLKCLVCIACTYICTIHAHASCAGVPAEASYYVLLLRWPWKLPRYSHRVVWWGYSFIDVPTTHTWRFSSLRTIPCFRNDQWWGNSSISKLSYPSNWSRIRLNLTILVFL